MSAVEQDSEIWSRSTIVEFSRHALQSCGADSTASLTMANAIAAAEFDGIPSHGLAYLPTYCEHLKCGKINRVASVTASEDGPIVRVDADSGFAHPAIDKAFERLVPSARRYGVSVAAIRNSYNCGVLGYHTEFLGRQGLVGIAFTNAPASIAPWGGLKPLFGTNPISVAAPDGKGGIAFIIDQSASVVSKSEVISHQRQGKEIPLGWTFDSQGQPTADPALGLKGTMVPSGGAKGVGLALFVELMAACLTGANLGSKAAPFSGTDGGPPRTGQFFIAIDPISTSSGAYAAQIKQLVESIADVEGARFPGARRLAHRLAADQIGVRLKIATIDRVKAVLSST